MSYIEDLIEGNAKSLIDMLKDSIGADQISKDLIRSALIAEAAPVPAGGDIYRVSPSSSQLLEAIQGSLDRDMYIIVKKILRSTKYAAVTWYSASGADNNPHRLAVEPLILVDQVSPV